ncbi:MAG: hypothetical protein DWB56_08155 [Candidatus Jettenia sp.]|nr:MAG: hypothetical protein EDM77_03265 [Candidatus Jettenia sp. AMX1]MBC6928918.1 hypothetical protein [Candidatus Jettenia sp.]MCE7879919.1 hypothetical protein [Candidatus Jettenia sp. AMX1]MCQ3926699.1 hypothetical protein [Candidatus Jettenia sp.]
MERNFHAAGQPFRVASPVHIHTGAGKTKALSYVRQPGFMCKKFKVFHDAVNTSLSLIVETQNLASLQGNEPTPQPLPRGE